MLSREWTAATIAAAVSVCAHASVQNNFTNNIVLIGYWPESGNMLRQFNTNPSQNPSGWVGEDWEGRGYNVHSFFGEYPDFSQDDPATRLGEADVGSTAQFPDFPNFRVDYQDTFDDFQRVVDELNPVAIVAFTQDDEAFSWEIEARQRVYRSVVDQNDPFRRRWQFDLSDAETGGRGERPDPDLPIFDTFGEGPDAVASFGDFVDSALPLEQIEAAVNALNAGAPDGTDGGDLPGATARIDNGGAGEFLSGWIHLLGLWHHELNSDEDAEFRSFAAGHIHVGQDLSIDQASLSTEATLRALTDYLDTVVPAPSGAAVVAALGLFAGARRRR